ncbi:hypothetical protein [Xanthocytophaga agilis]|uniref:Uncharacterized protein n=1 Tax=Xanthocytophaga agilis TaxID=3048010 RepID=A0AAE3R536_9BACT|nr:hypothetical protein [Xanthocytophaga agilis]MDJ1501574.1 hypothetical protein [Xanthocytophaga agilis]
MQIQETPEYQLIKTIYGDRKATRSQVPLLNHIDEGIQILVWEQAELTIQRAYCLHPIFQGDDSLLENYKNVSLDNLENRAILLVMEY